MLIPILASAEKVEIKGIWYNLIEKSHVAEVTYGNWDVYSSTYYYYQDDERYTGDITIPASIEYDGIIWNIKTIGLNAFRDCQLLKSISLPKGLVSIGVCAFYGCKSLKTITIPETVNQIDAAAFRGCKGLTKVYISDLMAWLNIKFGDNYFSSPHEANPLTNGKHLFLNGVEIKDLVIPEGVSTIGDFAFDGCEGLTSVKIPNGVTSIGYGAFSYCNGITNINIPNSVTSINHLAFEGCTGLTSVSIPNSVTDIGENVFAGCSNLYSLELSQAINHIKRYSFFDCSSLKSIIIPNSVTMISGSAFQNCISLKSLTIGNGIKIISRYSYESGAFENCKELTDVYCLAENVPNTDADAFKNSMIEYATLHVPSKSVNDYKAAEPWKYFSDIVPINEESLDRCATPEISYANGKISLSCETEGVEFISKVTVEDAKDYYDSEFTLSQTYKITVYATKAGYENSDVATREIAIENGQSLLFGDLNKDGKVNVADHVKLSDIIMNK